MSLLTTLIYVSSFSFFFFGLGCFFSPRMKTEFIRYGLGKERHLVGALQLIGAIGLLAGYFYNPLLNLLSAIGLSVLMVLGVGVRLKIRDSFVQTIPALSYALINAYIALLLLDHI